MAKRRKRLNKTRFLIFLLVVASMIFGVIKFTQFLITTLGNKGVNFKRVNTIEYIKRKDENRKVYIESFNQYIFKFEQKKLHAYDKKGNMLWEKTLDIDKVIVKGNKDNIVVVDCFGGKMYYIDYEGEIKTEHNFGKEIMDMKINDSGYALVMLQEEVSVFNSHGESISNFTIPNGEVIDGDLSPDNITIALTILVAEEKKFYSNILFYSLEGKVLAGKKFDNNVINKIFLISDKSLLVLSENSVLMLTSENNILWEKKFEETLNRGKLEDNELLVLNLVMKKNTIIDTKNKNIIGGLDLNGNILYKIPVAGEVLGLDTINDRIGVFTNRTIYIIDKKGNTILEKKINKDIKNIYWISKENLLVIYKDKLEVMEID
ncbi:MAG: DUF5711 family protein [Maledivibacter sp.]|nr:DUF5711 family protein [Maledivibacter sp.]